MDSRRLLALAALASLLAAPAAAQVRATPVVAGLTTPLAFVQDPGDPTVQYVAEQGGHIRVVQNGSLLLTDFLDLSGSIVSGGEQGLLGLAFPRDYAVSGRFYVNFTDPSGSTVVARFRRSDADPFVADPASRFDLLWSTGERVIRRPSAGHNGGDIVFGPDGFLYIGLGDGGTGDEPNYLSQDRTTLLGKMLRIDVSVGDDDAAGFSVPADNPFVGSDVPPEVWSVGFRNPWRFSFDDPAFGGTGALVIGDVGQSIYEEVDYEPSGRGGRNYGWSNREGAHDYDLTSPPAFEPLVDPIFEYTHPSMGLAAITGGYVYRGSAIPALQGRYVFADLTGRVWSLGLAVDPATGEATASDLREHTAELGGQDTLGFISSFGVDASGELYVVSLSGGTVFRLTAAPDPTLLSNLDAPGPGAVLAQPFLIAGWAFDPSAVPGPGIDVVHVWAYPATGADPIFVGAADYGGERPDVGAIYGDGATASGFGLMARGLAPGSYFLVVFVRMTATMTFHAAAVREITVQGGALMSVDLPAASATVSEPFDIGGWALDGGAASGSGVDTIHIYGFPGDGSAPHFLGVPGLGGFRPDVGAIFGSQFNSSGYDLLVPHLDAGIWDLVIFVHSSVSNAFEAARVVRVFSTGF